MPENRRMRIGVWLELPVSPHLRGEGTFDLLMNLVKNSSDRNLADWVFAVPVWAKDSLRDLLDEHKIRSDSREILLSGCRVSVLATSRLFSDQPRGLGIFGRTKAAAWAVLPMIRNSKPARWLATRSVATSRMTVIAAAAVLALVGAATGGYFLLRFAVPAAIGIAFVAACLRRRRVASWLLAHGADFPPARVLGKIIDCANSIFGRAARRAEAKARNLLHRRELTLLHRVASRRDDIDVWYVPHPGCGFAGLPRKRIVVAIPDLLYAEFATLYPSERIASETARIRGLVDAADRVISFSEYVRREHVVGFLGKPRERTAVIAHAPESIAESMRPATRMCGGRSRDAALFVIWSFVRLNSPKPDRAAAIPADYLRNFPFDEAPFLFTSSRNRPHDNFLCLLEAFELVLRRHHRSLKLFTTDAMNDDLHRFLAARRLELDVISVPHPPNEVRAAFHHLAALTVAPTLFDGAFPSPFSESVSMGTPIVMSSIPATREVVPGELGRRMLFDPHDPKSIAAAILRGLDHRDELLQSQQRLAAALSRRTWDDVADEYLTVFREACRREEVAAPSKLRKVA